MDKILISACLVGNNTKYNGGNNKHPLIDKLLEKFELIPFCPEVEGGLSVPRKPNELKEGIPYDIDGKNNYKPFLIGAEKAYNICLYFSIKTVILKDHSPSCGSFKIYDGSFKNKLKIGEGVTTTYLKSKGIRVISENEIEQFLNEING
jgi:uncharacterized protein YbbK (DUF523 family)